jgi:hypothetical protein
MGYPWSAPKSICNSRFPFRTGGKAAGTQSARCRDLSNAQWEILNTLIPEPIPRRDGRGSP